MEKKSYADECIERAETAPVHLGPEVRELAARLKKACDTLKIASQLFFKEDYIQMSIHLNQVIAQLEAPAGEK